MDEKLIFHVDVNSAFLSWESVERLKTNPDTLDLRTIPSAVGGEISKRHGVVLAKSTLAKSFGVVTGEPIHSALKKCPELVIVQPNHKLYEEYSNCMLELLYQYTPNIEPVSIDEAYLDMTDSIRNETPIEIASTIKAHIQRELLFTVNIGISTNKLLAKMASDFKKPNRIHTLFPDEISKKMWPLPLDELFFVGKASSKILKDLGFISIGDIAKADPAILKAHLGNKHGQQVYNYANGIGSDSLTVEKVQNKGYGNSTTLAYDITDFDSAKLVLLHLSENVGARLRKDNVSCLCISVEITDSDFKKQSHQTTLDNPTNATTTIYEIACNLLNNLWNGVPLRLLGIRTSKITTEKFTQINLFDMEKPEKLKKLDQALDTIRSKYGSNAIARASIIKPHQDKN